MKKKLISMGIILGLCFCSACGNNAKEAQEAVAEEKTEAEVKEAGETAAEEQEKEAQTAEESKEEQSATEDIKLAMKEGQYDKAIEMLNAAQSEMEADEYAILLSNAYLYKGDYVAAADVLVEETEKTGSDALKDRLEYIRENTVAVESKHYNNDEYYRTATYEYDEDGNEIKRQITDVSEAEERIANIESEYDDKGNIIKEVSTGFDGSVITETTEYEYQQDGTLGKTTLHRDGVHSDGGTFSVKEEREYDSNGNPILENNYSDGELEYYYKWEYDADGNKTRREYCWISNGESSFVNYTYEYDDAGNIVKKTCSDDAGNIIEIEEYDSDGNQLKYEYVGYYSTESEYNSLNDAVLIKIKSSGDDAASTDTTEYVYQFIGEIE